MAVYDAIVARLAENGYTAASAKLDPACNLASNRSTCLVPIVLTKNGHSSSLGEPRRWDLERCAIDPAMYGKTAVVMCLIPRLAANSIVVANATPEKIDAITAKLRSMNEGRNHEIFMTGVSSVALVFLPMRSRGNSTRWSVKRTHMRKKIPGVMKSLKGYGAL